MPENEEKSVIEIDEPFEVQTALSVRSTEVILYPENGASVDSVLSIVEEKNLQDFAIVLHDKDNKKPHIHLMLWFKSAWPLDAIIKWFSAYSVTRANCGRIKSKNGALAYLTHSNRPEKYQYPLEAVVHSKGLKEEIEVATAKARRKVEIKALCDAVALGEISPRALLTSVNGVELRDYRKLIDSSIDSRLTLSVVKKEREMKVIYVYGKPGSGKSTFARWLASSFATEAPYVSSSSNDPLQDYMLEPVIILDDLRGDSFKFSDLLKLLDNYVPSTVKCRYKNKSIDAKYVIITSTRKPSDLYGEEVFKGNDNLDQLYRRLNGGFEIDDDGSIYPVEFNHRDKQGHLSPVKTNVPMGDMAVVFKTMEIAKKTYSVMDDIANMLESITSKPKKGLTHENNQSKH